MYLKKGIYFMQNRNFKLLLSVAIFGLFGYLFYRIFDVERKVYKSTDSDVKLAAGSVMGSNASNLKKLEKINSEILEEDRAKSTMIEEDSIDLTDPLAGENADRVILSDVSGGNSSGVVYFLSDESNGIQLKLTAELANLAEDNTYEAWIYNDASEEYISLGSLTKNASGEWTLSYSDGSTYADFNTFIVSSDSEVKDAPETPVLEGNL